MTVNEQLINRVRLWLVERPGWHTLHEIRKGADLWGDYHQRFEGTHKYVPPLRRIVADLAKAGAVETRGGWDRTFEVRAKE